MSDASLTSRFFRVCSSIKRLRLTVPSTTVMKLWALSKPGAGSGIRQAPFFWTVTPQIRSDERGWSPARCPRRPLTCRRPVGLMRPVAENGPEAAAAILRRLADELDALARAHRAGDPCAVT